jgi:hypothetical protein
VNPARRARARHGASIALLALLVAPPARAKSQGENVHRADARCEACHTADATALHADPEAARHLLAPDLEARCAACHGDEGPSHETGIPPRPPPPALPLSDQGRITCATCHYMHAESNAFGDFVRIDNRRGGLCLTCHQLSELQ